MRAINQDQPWAELIPLGRKTIELRTRRPAGLGRLALQANLRIHTYLCAKFALDPDRLPTGALVGSVMVAEVIHFDQPLWEATRDQHLSDAFGPGRWLGWRLEDPRRLAEPLPFRGLPGMFTLPEELAERLR